MKVSSGQELILCKRSNLDLYLILTNNDKLKENSCSANTLQDLLSDLQGETDLRGQNLSMINHQWQPVLFEHRGFLGECRRSSE